MTEKRDMTPWDKSAEPFKAAEGKPFEFKLDDPGALGHTLVYGPVGSGMSTTMSHMAGEGAWPQHSHGCAIHSDEDFHIAPTAAALIFVRRAAAFIREKFPSGCRHRIVAYRRGGQTVALDFRDSAGGDGRFSFTFLECAPADVAQIADTWLSGYCADVPVMDDVDGIMLANLILAELREPMQPNADDDCGRAVARTWSTTV